MSHSPYREQMAASLDEPLAPADRAALEAHVQSCRSCRAVWETLLEVHELFSVAPAAQAPIGFANRATARLAGRDSRPRQFGGGLVLVLVAAVLVGLTVVAPLAVLVTVVVRQPGALVALVLALVTAINVLEAVSSGLWLALTALLDWSAGQPAAAALVAATLPLAALWFYCFNRLSTKVVLAQ